MDEEYFDIQDHVVVTNPTSESFTWQVGGERTYSLDPGQVKRLHGSSARLYVKKMTDLIIIQANRVQELYSESYRKEIADKLIVSVVKDNEDVAEVAVDHEREARENDSSPVKPEAKPKKEVAFPDLKKTQPADSVAKVDDKTNDARKLPTKDKKDAEPTKQVEPKAKAKN